MSTSKQTAEALKMLAQSACCYCGMRLKGRSAGYGPGGKCCTTCYSKYVTRS